MRRNDIHPVTFTIDTEIGDFGINYLSDDGIKDTIILGKNRINDFFRIGYDERDSEIVTDNEVPTIFENE